MAVVLHGVQTTLIGTGEGGCLRAIIARSRPFHLVHLHNRALVFGNITPREIKALRVVAREKIVRVMRFFFFRGIQNSRCPPSECRTRVYINYIYGVKFRDRSVSSIIARIDIRRKTKFSEEMAFREMILIRCPGALWERVRHAAKAGKSPQIPRGRVQNGEAGKQTVKII